VILVASDTLHKSHNTEHSLRELIFERVMGAWKRGGVEAWGRGGVGAWRVWVESHIDTIKV